MGGLIAFVLVLGAIGAALGDEEAEQAVASPSERADPAGPQEVSGESEAPLGSRDNPYPIGDAATFSVRAFGDADHSVWSLVVDGPGTDITQLVASENMFNPSPDEGSLFFGVPVSLTLLEAGKEPLDTFWNIDFEAVGKASMTSSDLGFFGCGVVPQGFDENQQVFIGGTLSGVMCFEVSEGDFEAGVMLSVDERERVFLEAGPAAEPADPPTEEVDAAGADTAPVSTAVASADAADEGEASAPVDAGVFSYESRLSGYVWSGEILGYTFVPPNSLSDDDVEGCVVVVGTASPSAVEEYGLTNGVSNPEFSLLVNGRVVDSTVLGCDNQPARDAGYSPLLFAQMTAGSEFPFYVSFELPGNLADPDTVEVIVGDTDSDRYQRIQATELDTIPPGSFTGKPLPVEVVQPEGTVVSYYDSDSQWEVLVDGVVVLEAAERRDGGSCVIVVGRLTPTDTGDALVADGWDAPSVSVVVGGLTRGSDWAGCEDDAAEAAGYGDPDDADVAAGTTYHFFDSTYLPTSVAPNVEAVSIGVAPFDDIDLVAAPLLDSIPTVGA